MRRDDVDALIGQIAGVWPTSRSSRRSMNRTDYRGAMWTMTTPETLIFLALVTVAVAMFRSN